MRTSLARPAILLLGLTVASIGTVQAQGAVNKYGNPEKHPAKPTTAAITAEELRTRLYIFADDSMQGRRVATVGNMMGTAYIAAELKRLGVEPAGDNGGYFQRLPYVTRNFASNSTLSAGGTALAFNADFVPIVGARVPKAIMNAPVIYGGVEGDTATQITPAQAAGKFVILSAGAAPVGGGRGGFGGASAVARFPEAVAVAVADLDALSMAERVALNVPMTATSIAGRGGPPLTADNAAHVPVPNPAFQGTAGDIVMTNGKGGIGIIRDGQLIAGSLAAGQTPATVQARLDAMATFAKDSVALVAERRDTLVAAAKRFLASGYKGTVSFRSERMTMDSAQVVTLACAPAGGGRGGFGGAAASELPAGCPAAPAGRGGFAGRGAGGRGGNGARGGGGAAAADVAPVASFRITSAAATKLMGTPLIGLPAGIAGGTASANLVFVEAPSDWARNVVGIVRGSDPKLRGEYVAIGGHNDHNGFSIGGARDHDSLKAYNDAVLKLKMAQNLIGLAPAQLATVKVNMDSIRKLHPVARMDSIQNGADDDGSGSMGVLEIAEAIAKMPVKPKRSILFVWHTGEEGGLLGSAYFTANPTVPIDSVVAQINIDMIGRGRAEDMIGGGPTYLGAVGSKRMSTDLNKQMLAVNAKEAKPLHIDYRFDDATLGVAVDGKPAQWAGYNNIYGRSDHANYANKCVPIVFFFTGLHGDYHQITDEPQYIDYPHYSLITNYIRDLLVDVADGATRPPLDHPCVRK